MKAKRKKTPPIQWTIKLMGWRDYGREERLSSVLDERHGKRFERRMNALGWVRRPS